MSFQLPEIPEGPIELMSINLRLDLESESGDTVRMSAPSYTQNQLVDEASLAAFDGQVALLRKYVVDFLDRRRQRMEESK